MKTEVSHEAPMNFERGLFFDASGTLFCSDDNSQLGIALFQDTSTAIAICRARKFDKYTLRTGLITNWGRRVNTIVKDLGLENIFDIIVTADDVKRAKPDSEIFLFACHGIGLPPSQCVHIGDSLYDDALGAQSAGFKSLWINRYGVSSSDFHAQREIRMLKHEPMADLNEVQIRLHEIFSN